MKPHTQDKALYPNGKTHCLLLPQILRRGGKLAMKIPRTHLFIGVNKVEARGLLEQGLYLWVDPKPIEDKTYELHVRCTPEEYEPMVQGAADFKDVEADFVPAAYSKIFRNHRAPMSRKEEGSQDAP